MEPVEKAQRRLLDLKISPAQSHNNSTSSLSEGLAAERKASSTPPNPLYITTSPPIFVPPPAATISRFDVNANGSFDNSGRCQDYTLSSSPPKSIEPYKRNPSISFANSVQLDTGHQLPLHHPLPKDIPHGEAADLSFKKHAVPKRQTVFDLWADSTSKDEALSSRGTSYGSEADLARFRNGHTPQYTTSRQAYDDGNENRNGKDYTDQEPVASLTSQSTASPQADEVQTPPTLSIDVYGQNDAPGRRRGNTASLSEGPAPWPWSLNNSNRSKSFNTGSLRKSTRAQRKASTPSAVSPASQFLSGWKQPRAPDPDDEGQEIGSYVIGKTIGFGGFSVVKEAHTIEQGMDVCRAVKIVKKKVRDTEKENEDIQAEFEHEVNLWRHLSHRYILGLISVYDTPYATFCITSYNIGGTLFDLVKNNRSGIAPRLARRYSYQLASALRYLHQDMHIVHRDIKLENVLLNTSEDPEGNILVCDFGMAEFLTGANSDNDSDDDAYEGHHHNRPPPKVHGPANSSSAIAVNNESPVIGSLQYAAPELIESDNPIIQTYVDVWAFGVVVYTLHVGDLPFHHGLRPKLQSMIMEAAWNQEMYKSKATGEFVKSIDVVRGCLEKSVTMRWDISRVLDSSWLVVLSEDSP